MEVGLQLRALHLLLGASGKADEELQSYSSQCVAVGSVGHTYMSLATFCDQILRDEERSDTGGPVTQHRAHNTEHTTSSTQHRA